MKRISPIVVPLIIALFIISSVVPRAAHAAPFPPPFNSIDTFLTAQVNALSSVFSTIGCAIYKATGNDICANDDTNEPPAGGGLTSKSPEGGERSDLEEQAEEANSANEANTANEANNTRVVERIVERITEVQPLIVQSTGITQNDLDILENELRQAIARVGSDNATVSSNFRTIAHTQKIDKLQDVTITNATIESGVSGLSDSDIPNDITASNYLPLTGGTLTGSLTGTNFSFASTTATSTIAGHLDVTGNINLDGNFLQNDAPFISSQWTVSGDDIYFNTGNVGVGTTSPYAKLSVVGQAVAEYFTATSTTASTFPYASTTAITTTSLFPTDIYSFTLQGDLLANGQNITNIGTATGTDLVFTNATTTNATSTNFHTDNFTADGALTINGVATDMLLSLNSANELTATSTPTLSHLFATSTTATSTFAGGLEANALNITATNATSTFANGISFANGGIAFADGSVQTVAATAGAFTSSGGFTTLTNTSDNVGIGTSSPYARLSVVGETVSEYFTATSTSATSTIAGGFNVSDGGLTYDFSTTNVGIGTQAPTQKLSVFETTASPQFRISYDASNYTDFTTSAAGSLTITPSGDVITIPDDNLKVCAGGACPSEQSGFAGTGNIIAEGIVYAEGVAPTECPSGMLYVPPDNEIGTDGFCVDKYEAKDDGSGNAVSEAAGTPWVSITQYDAAEECRNVGKRLISEEEWMTIARNVEDVGDNWDGGTAGTNNMSDGHSDNSPANSLAADTTGDPDDDPCVGTGQTCDQSTWDSQRRTYQLSTGEYIWDFGGNVWEWVNEVTTDNHPVQNNWSAWTACTTPDGICGNTLTTNDERYGGNTTATRAFQRGGNWGDGSRGGAFTLGLHSAPSGTNGSIGFRCVR